LSSSSSPATQYLPQDWNGVREKTPYRDGTTAVIFEPFDFLARLAALAPLPRVHSTRYHGVFAPASTLRGAVTPAGRGRGLPPEPATAEPQPAKHVSITWMQRLKRVFAIDIETCQRCGGPLKVIAEPVLRETLYFLREDGANVDPLFQLLERGVDDLPRARLPPSRRRKALPRSSGVGSTTPLTGCALAERAPKQSRARASRPPVRDR
jgi:hypothetical protein